MLLPGNILPRHMDAGRNTAVNRFVGLFNWIGKSRRITGQPVAAFIAALERVRDPA